MYSNRIEDFFFYSFLKSSDWPIESYKRLTTKLQEMTTNLQER